MNNTIGEKNTYTSQFNATQGKPQTNKPENYKTVGTDKHTTEAGHVPLPELILGTPDTRSSKTLPDPT